MSAMRRANKGTSADEASTAASSGDTERQTLLANVRADAHAPQATPQRRSAWYVRPGSLAALRCVQEDLPPPTARQVQVAVHYLGLNFADVFACKGLYGAAPKHDFVPGLEFSGVVTRVGSDHDTAADDDDDDDEKRQSNQRTADARATRRDFRVGDRVMGVLKFGAFASHVNIGREYLLHVPDSWTFAEAAGFVVQALTAYYGLVTLGSLKPGMNVLVHSGAGGVGLYALQIAQRRGATVVTTVGQQSKKDFLLGRQHGAGSQSAMVSSLSLHEDQVIVRASSRQASQQLDAALQSMAARGTQRDNQLGFDIVLDSLLGNWFHAAYQKTNPAGRLVVLGAGVMADTGDRPNFLRLAWNFLTRPKLDPLKMIGDNKSVMCFNLIWLYDRVDELTEMLLDLMSMDLPPPHVGHTFDFTDLPNALRFFQTGRNVGKVVVRVVQ